MTLFSRTATANGRSTIAAHSTGGVTHTPQPRRPRRRTSNNSHSSAAGSANPYASEATGSGELPGPARSRTETASDVTPARAPTTGRVLAPNHGDPATAATAHTAQASWAERIPNPSVSMPRAW